MTIKDVHHVSEYPIPHELKVVLRKAFNEHREKIGLEQFIEMMNISIDMRANNIIIQTTSSDFRFDKTKGLEQFID